MTATLERPAPPTAPSPLAAGLPAAVWALAAGLVCVGLPVLLVWAADSRSGAAAVEALRTAGLVWSVAHGVPVSGSAGALSLVPLGLVALPLALLVRAGRSAARALPVEDLRAAGSLTAAVAGPYALAAALVASVSGSAAARPSVTGAVVAASLVAALGAGGGVLRQARLGPAVLSALPVRLRRLLRPTAIAVLLLVAAGAVLCALALVLSAGRAAELARASAPGAVGGVALLLVGVALVPNAVVWGAAWWAGPGFAVGSGTTVGPLAHDLGAVPALPMLAALPSAGPPVWLGVLALAVPLLAGAVAGRTVDDAGGWRDGLLCGALAGAVLAGLALVTAGAAGDGRLTDVGATWWQVGPAVAGLVAAGAAASAWEAARRRRA